MKIGVAGTFIRDRIIPFHGEEVSSFGGIFFTVSFLANLAGEDTTIYPVAEVGADFFDDLEAELAVYSNVSLERLIKVERENTQVQLHYTAPEERYEITTEPMLPLAPEALAPLHDVDALLVNLVSGTDLELAALTEFRQHSDALIYLDFHSRALGIDDCGKRFYRRPNDWQSWVDHADVLQLNEMEARTLAGISREVPRDQLKRFGESVLNDHPAVCHVTLAESGSFLFHEEKQGVVFEPLPAERVERVVDIIGCGDAFAAGYILHFLKNGDIAAATTFAHRVAAFNCTFMGSSGVRQLREVAWQI